MTSGGSSPIKVIDFSTHIAGPTASALLRQLGAEVIKVENPRSGDGNRSVAAAPYIAGEGIYHVALNPGTRSVAAHPRSPHWDEVVKAGAKWADVVIVGARTADAERLGIAYEQLRQVNERLVYCEISGYGNSGPWSDKPAHGLNPDAMAGLIPPLTAQEADTVFSWIPAGTTTAGVHAALGVMSALYQRELTGEGRLVSVSLWRSAMWWNWRSVMSAANLDQPWDLRLNGSRYTSYRTSDGGHIIVAPIEEKFWEVFVEAIDLPEDLQGRADWSGRYEFGVGSGFEREREAIQSRISAGSRDHWERLFNSIGVPCSPVLTTSESVNSEHAAATTLMQDVRTAEGIAKVMASPFHVSEQSATVLTTPALGQHSREVLDLFGLTIDPEILAKPFDAATQKEKDHV